VRTTVRGVALLLLAATAVVYAGLTVPLQRKAAAAAEAYRRARDDRRAARTRLGELERRESALRRAAPARGDATSSPRDPVGQTRHGIVASLEGAGLSGIRLAVRPGQPPAVAQVRLSAEGPFPDVVRLTGELVRPGTGVVLEKFHLSGRDSRVAMSLEGVGLEAAP
jgi:hypothetical protein